MNFDVELLKKIKNQVIKYSLIIYGALSSILIYKFCRKCSEFFDINGEDISYKLKSLWSSITEVLDSCDGWVVFESVIFIFAMTLVICRFLEWRITQKGGSIYDDNF